MERALATDQSPTLFFIANVRAILAKLIPAGLDHDTCEASSPFSRKDQKALFALTRTFPAKSATAQTKAFCFFFSKKKTLPYFLWVNLQGG
jgi:hypothetical protein